jgi:hypothetical protein
MPFDGKIELFTETNPVADVLRRARALIDTPEKWCQGQCELGEAKCALGAILGADPNYAAAALALNRVVAPNIPAWNDAPERTHADVMAAFDRAITLAESEG